MEPTIQCALPSDHNIMHAPAPFIEETRFGNWFINSATWKNNVLCRALDDLQRLMPAVARRYPRILDVGCGYGHSFAELARRFSPDHIAGLDADPAIMTRAGAAALSSPCEVRLHAANAAHLEFPNADFDMVFCHQSFHHIVEQEPAMAEFFRVLKPGGVLLFAESTRRYIHSLPIRLLFRHPMEVQRTADEYTAMIRTAGFELPDARISLPYLWWSRPDIGILERLGVPVPEQREETLINAVAIKPIVT